MISYNEPEMEIIVFELSDAFTDNTGSKFTDGQGAVEEDPFG